MKIKELLKYSILPLFILLIYLASFLAEKVDFNPNNGGFIILLLIICLVFLVILILLFLVLFAFFRDIRIPILMFSIAVFFNSLLTIILSKANTPLLISVSEDAEILTALLLFYLAIGYFVFTIRYASRVKGNRFLLAILIIGGLVFTFDFIYFGLILAEPELEKGLLMTLGVGLFLLFSFIVIFSLPNSDYIEWEKEHKQLFLKSILVPWSLILFLAFVSFIVNPSADISKEKKSNRSSFGMEKYEIKAKEGLE